MATGAGTCCALPSRGASAKQVRRRGRGLSVGRTGGAVAGRLGDWAVGRSVGHVGRAVSGGQVCSDRERNGGHGQQARDRRPALPLGVRLLTTPSSLLFGRPPSRSDPLAANSPWGSKLCRVKKSRLKHFPPTTIAGRRCAGEGGEGPDLRDDAVGHDHHGRQRHQRLGHAQAPHATHRLVDRDSASPRNNANCGIIWPMLLHMMAQL